ncbi:MAG: urea ABC transporter permease subunit UrtB [Pseudomonadota bacterium]
MNSKTIFFYPYLLRAILAFLISCISFQVIAQEITDDKLFMQTYSQLTEKNFKKKIRVVQELSSFNYPQVTNILEALLQGDLFYIKKDKKIIITEKKEQGYNASDPIDASSLGLVKKSSIKKIRTNNKLRKILRGILSQQKLFNSDISIRKEAINEVLKTINPQLLPLLLKAKQQERDEDIIQSLELAIAFIELRTDNKEQKMRVINYLGNSLHPIAKEQLQLLLAKDEHDKYIETDKDIIHGAQHGIKEIGYKESFYSKLETLFFGLSLGSVLLLASIGLAITFGVMGVINMAHGELMMLGAYTTYLVQQMMPNHIGLSLIVALPAAFIISALFGMAIERGVIRHLYSRPLETLLATFGISLILQQLVRTVISAQNVAVESPSWLSGSLVFNPMFSITYNRLYILIFSLLVFTFLLLLLKKTSLGLQVRAVSQNRSMAKAMGIKTQWIDSLTFGLGSGVAGIAGVALSQLTNVGPNLGQSYIIDSFMVVVFGGVESLWGTLVAAMTLGIANKFLEPWAGAVMAKIIVLIFLILFIQKRPKGLFPQKGRSSVGS